MVGGLRPGDAGVFPLGRQGTSCWFAGVPGVGYVCFVGYGLPGGRGVLQLYRGSYQGWT